MIEADRRAIVEGANASTHVETHDLKNRSREVIRGAFQTRGARKIANAVRGVVRERDGFARGVVFSKFGRRDSEGFTDYLLPYVTGARITPDDPSGYLYIPVGRTRRARRERIDAADRKNVRFIPSGKPGKIYLVRQTKTRTTLIAVLLKSRNIKKVLDFARLAARAGDRVLRGIADRLAARGAS